MLVGKGLDFFALIVYVIALQALGDGELALFAENGVGSLGQYRIGAVGDLKLDEEVAFGLLFQIESEKIVRFKIGSEGILYFSVDGEYPFIYIV